MFKPGYRFPVEMSYLELCSCVSQESNKAGFDPLRPRLVNKARQLDYVIFYCVHSRNHGDQSREAKGKPEATSKRANRSEEGTRCMFTSCEFEIRVQRNRDVDVPLNMSKEELKVLKAETKFQWYVDSGEDQKKDGRYMQPDCHCCDHRCDLDCDCLLWPVSSCLQSGMNTPKTSVISSHLLGFGSFSRSHY